MVIKASSDKEFFTDERCFILEVLNSSESENVSVARARVEPGVTTALHELEADEIYYILEGTGKAEPAVEPGDLVLIKRGETQRISNTSESDLVFLCICQPRFTPERYTSLEQPSSQKP